MFQCLITAIPATAFATLTSLVTLFVCKCTLSIYVSFTNEINACLHHSDLSVNMITSLPQGLFSTQSQLNALYANMNII